MRQRYELLIVHHVYALVCTHPCMHTCAYTHICMYAHTHAQLGRLEQCANHFTILTILSCTRIHTHTHTRHQHRTYEPQSGYLVGYQVFTAVITE